MKWVEALKEYAKTNGKYVVPKKGTPAYDAVKKIMGAGGATAPSAPVEMKAEGASKPVRKRAPKPPAGVESLSAVPSAAPKAKAKAPARRARHSGGKKVKIEESNASDLRPVRSVGGDAAGSAEAGGALIPEGVTKRSVMKSKNPSAILESAANSHIAIASPENYVKLKPVANLKKELSKVEHPAIPALVVAHKATNSDPFSFQNFRNHLGC